MKEEVTGTVKVTKYFTEYVQEKLTKAIKNISKKERLDIGDAEALREIVAVIQFVDWETLKNVPLNQTDGLSSLKDQSNKQSQI